MCLCGDTQCPSCGCLQGTLESDHYYLCHSDGSECLDGCDVAAIPEQLKKYLKLDATRQDKE